MLPISKDKPNLKAEEQRPSILGGIARARVASGMVSSLNSPHTWSKWAGKSNQARGWQPKKEGKTNPTWVKVGN